MRSSKEIINFNNLKKKENIFLLLGISLFFLLVAIAFLLSDQGNIENTSPYVDDCSFTNELVEGMYIEQSFFTKLDVIEGIYLETATHLRKNTSSIELTIVNAENEKIYSEIFSLESVLDNQFSYFAFENPCPVKSGESLLLHIESKDNVGGNGISLVYSNYDSYREGELEIDDEKKLGDIFFQIKGYNYNNTKFNAVYMGGMAFLLIYIIVVSIIILCKENQDEVFTFVKVPFINVMKIVLIFCATISIGYIDHNVINTVLERTEIEYMVHIEKPEFFQVDEVGVRLNFLNHAKDIVSNNIMIKRCNTYFGEISYSILEMDGNVIKEKSEHFSTIVSHYNSEWDELVIQCSDLGLKQGKEYGIVLNFSQVEPVYLVMNQEGQVQQRQIMENSYIYVYMCILILISVVMLLMIAYAIIIGFSNKVFLISALLTGVFACFIQTPCAADDEYRHFLRVYDLVDNSIQAEHTENWINAKGNIHVDINRKADIIEVSSQANGLRLLDMRQNYDNKSYAAEMNYQGCIDEIIRLVKQEENATSYVSIVATNGIPALVYFPQIILAYIGKLLGMGAVGIYYMARLGNMLFAAFSVYLIVNELPEYRNIFYIIYFAPNTFWLSASCNRDALVTSIVSLLIAYIIYIKTNKLKVFEPKRLIILSVLTTVIAVSKLPYILVVGLLIILDKENLLFESDRKCFFAKIGLIILLGTIGVAGYKFSCYENRSENTVDAETKVPKKTTHITYAIENPRKVLSVFEKRLSYFCEDVYRAFEGYKYKFAYKYIFISLIIFTLSKKKITIKEKLWCVALFSVIWLSIIVVGYTLMAPDYGSIWGVNPRYMIPILPLLALIIGFGNDKTDKVVNLIVPTCILTLVTTNIISMITIYW